MNFEIIKVKFQTIILTPQNKMYAEDPPGMVENESKGNWASTELWKSYERCYERHPEYFEYFEMRGNRERGLEETWKN